VYKRLSNDFSFGLVQFDASGLIAVFEGLVVGSVSVKEEWLVVLESSLGGFAETSPHFFSIGVARFDVIFRLGIVAASFEVCCFS
jgi:hypothetical protein